MPTIKKTGEKISWKEALKRFKRGVEEITPIQKLTNDIRGTFITLFGYIFALGAVIWKFNTIGALAVGLILIFLGSIITTGLTWLSLRKQLKFIKNLDLESEEEVKEEEVKNG